jgi:hypothetical protein
MLGVRPFRAFLIGFSPWGGNHRSGQNEGVLAGNRTSERRPPRIIQLSPFPPSCSSRSRR